LGFWGKFFIKKEINFYELLKNQCDKTLEGIKVLQEYCITGDELTGKRVIEIEQEGDLQRRILIDEINNAFVTPIEREDLFDLSRAIDDILDYARTTIEELQIYNVKPNEDIKAIINILVDMTNSLATAVHQLQYHKNISTEEAVKVKKFENKIEDLYRQSLARLFESDDIKYILKNRELYRHLSNAADKGDIAANIICHIIVKLS
jgi:uncharacterized protein Yka (UPF0111/DUF47 family)